MIRETRLRLSPQRGRQRRQPEAVAFGRRQAPEHLERAERQAVLGLELSVERAGQLLVRFEQPDPRVGVDVGPPRQPVVAEDVGACGRMFGWRLLTYACSSNCSREKGPNRMEPEQIIVDVQDGILTITLNRPDRMNAWTETMARELIEAFDRADADDEVRAVIVTGAGRALLRRRRSRARRRDVRLARARAAARRSRATTAVSSRSGSSSRPSR